jgi:hypothetical protein
LTLAAPVCDAAVNIKDGATFPTFAFSAKPPTLRRAAFFVAFHCRV